MRAEKRLIHAATMWVRRQPPKVKAFLAVVSGMAALVLLRFIVHDHDNLFVAAESVHSLGISVLIYKLTKEKTCAEVNYRVDSPFVMVFAGHIYNYLSYELSFVLNHAVCFKHHRESDLVIPCAVLALCIHPSTSHNLMNRIFWAFCVYLEAVSVLPQLQVMQNTKIVEPFTAHYVFALGVARFLSCAHWVLQVLDSRGHLLVALGYGLWPSMVLISEIVQTFILADFCYYYIKSVFGGQLVLRLPSGVV
ncbi:ER lumen retaining receptor [Gossypium arboreum]|uniref:ER lumen retaining receptor n=1 Tax=Gossypium arboreum TaxID=29729 RepID=A0A0B0PY44_GOSAR|nr:ER lumen retaining receptor [Gossypium arboreum]